MWNGKHTVWDADGLDGGGVVEHLQALGAAGAVCGKEQGSAISGCIEVRRQTGGCQHWMQHCDWYGKLKAWARLSAASVAPNTVSAQREQAHWGSDALHANCRALPQGTHLGFCAESRSAIFSVLPRLQVRSAFGTSSPDC